MTTKSTVLLAALFALAASSCATTQQAPQSLEDLLKDKNYRMGQEVDRIQNYTINGWNYVNRENLILHDGVNRRYLVTFRNMCQGLPDNELVAYTTTTSQLTKFDKFLVRDKGSRIIDHCYIQSLHKLEKIS